MIKIVFIGGTYRAKISLDYLLSRQDIEIVYAIFMKGNENEHVYATHLEDMAKKAKLKFVVTERITELVIETISKLTIDVIYGGGVWRSMVPENFRKMAKFGYIGLHGTALPEYRGMAGINWQIMNGADKIKMRMLQLSDGIDDGDLIADENNEILEYSVDIDNNLHLQEILDEYDKQHLKATGDLMDLLKTQTIRFIKQDIQKATYSCHFGPEDAEIDWSKSTRSIFNLIRSQSKPYSGAYTYFKGKKITIWRAEPLYNYLNYQGKINGKVVERNLQKKYVVILTADAAIKIIEAQCGNVSAVTKLFSSIREKCKSKTEAIADFIEIKYQNQFQFQ